MQKQGQHAAYNRLQQKALRILSLRDHSESELRQKLKLSQDVQLTKGADSTAEEALQVLEQVIDWCKSHQYLDDARFASCFLSMRSRKGYGAQRISMELSQKGIERSVIETLLAETDIDWCKIGLSVAQRKFGDPLPEAWQAKVKVQRFLMSRGFGTDEIREIYLQDDE